MEERLLMCFCWILICMVIVWISMVVGVEVLSIWNIVNIISGSLEQGLDIIFSIITCLVSFATGLFNIAYVFCFLFGSILGERKEREYRVIGLIMVIVINTILILFFVANCSIVIWWFNLPINNEASTFIPVFAIAISVCQGLLIGYAIISICLICEKLDAVDACRKACKNARERKDIEMVGM